MQNAPFLRRLASMLYDGLLSLALFVLTILVFIAFNGGEAIETSENLALQITLAIVVFGFFVGYWVRAGRTLGMQSWRLQLEYPDGSRPGFGAASLRFFAALISWAPFGLGFFWQLWDRDKLTWHDRLSNTRLVYYPKETP